MPNYKAGSRRAITAEESYAMGMQYTNTPLGTGFCKTLLNYDLKDNGECLVPRPGYRTLHHLLASDSSTAYQIHHTAMSAVEDTITSEDSSKRYILSIPKTAGTEVPFLDCQILIENSFVSDFASQDQSFITPQLIEEPDTQTFIRVKERTIPQSLHNLSLTRSDVFKNETLTPVHTRLNNVTVIPVRQNDTYGFAKLVLKETEGAYTASLELLSPKVITPTEAVNYGYNMLDATPYGFEDVLTAAAPAGFIFLEGILPYKDETCTALRFNAKVGEKITFRLYTQAPDQTSRFRFRWEVRDLHSDDITVYEDQEKTPNVYHFSSTQGAMVNEKDNSLGVKVTFQSPYKQFSVTVIAYSETDLTEPVQVITFASYSFSADAAGSTYGIAVKSYDLTSATDMCVWQQRVVLWGVKGATNMLFMSDVNDPTYFPYPQNAELFEEDVVACIPFMGALLVFTQNRLYKMSMGADGMTYAKTVIQDNLTLSTFDRETITVVQNMVYFKNGNYYYMIVPRTSSSSAGELQLAPISKPITQLLDNFEDSVKDMLFMLYNFEDANVFPIPKHTDAYDVRILDYHNYLDNATIRNVYKFELVLANKETKVVTEKVLCLDFILNYDTMTRVWNIYIRQANPDRMLPYQQTVTDTTVYVNLVRAFSEESGGENTYYSWIKPDVLNPMDDFALSMDYLFAGRVIKNHQLLDTGYRALQNTHQKRFREVQFHVNSVSQAALVFGTQFMLDDQARKELYQYNVEQVIDEYNPEHGYIHITREVADPIIVAGATVLADLDDPEKLAVPGEKTVLDDTIMVQYNKWILDLSQLASVTMAKIRHSVSGKGYSPRLIIVSYNEKSYELLGHSWVYRMMYAR